MKKSPPGLFTEAPHGGRSKKLSLFPFLLGKSLQVVPPVVVIAQGKQREERWCEEEGFKLFPTPPLIQLQCLNMWFMFAPRSPHEKGHRCRSCSPTVRRGLCNAANGFQVC